jgi:hypothetical protein
MLEFYESRAKKETLNRKEGQGEGGRTLNWVASPLHWQISEQESELLLIHKASFHKLGVTLYQDLFPSVEKLS